MRRLLLSFATLAACALAPAAQAELYYVIIAGLGGEKRYEEAFAEQVTKLTEVARRSTSADRVKVLAGPNATRDNLEIGRAHV